MLLTWNEEANVGACLASLAAQEERRFEVLVLDAASRDRTAAVVREAGSGFPVPLRLEVAPRRTSVGEARNRGVELAAAPAVAFLSADAEAEPGWAAAALRGLERADLVYGPQEHAPPAGGVGAAVRALRYHHFPGEAPADPAALASHVNAAIRADVLRAFPFGRTTAASALDDLLLARRAARAGRRVAYEPAMRVRHRDAVSARAELRKNVREGLGWGAYARELGLHKPALAWGGLLGGAACAAAAVPPLALPSAALLWAPAARRAWRSRGRVPLARLALGAAASPAFDLAFLAAYVRGLLRPEAPPAARPSSTRSPEDSP